MTRLVLLVVALTFAQECLAQQEIVDQFQKRSHTHAGLTLPYRLFVPADYDTTRTYPLVLALHGAGERGTDNERQIALHRLATSWADPVNQAVNPAFVVAPQVPPERRWSAELPVDESDFIDVQLTTLSILDSLEHEFKIDLERVYVTGLSMGGHGTWDFISRLPDRFAAAVPMSGNADPTQAPGLMHIPIWAFHGESDTVVRPFSARAMIQGMEDLGRDVVYTDCLRSPVFETNYDCPGTLPAGELSDAIDRHADLIFTSARNVGHGPWTVWYDHSLLADWLFSKRRVDPDVISVASPSQGDSWSGVETVNWSSGAVQTDTVEVWISLNEGPWEPVGVAIAGAGAYSLDTSALADAGFGRLRLFVKDSEGRVYGRATSEPFLIDNGGNGSPHLDVEDEPLRFEPYVAAEVLDLSVLASDPEGAALAADILYSVDGGATFAVVDTRTLVSSLDRQILSLDLTGLPNSSEARLRISISDGLNNVFAETATFIKQTPRLANDYVEHVAGEGIGNVTLHFIQPQRLTGHRYRIRIDDTDAAAKNFTVDDLDLATNVLTGVPLSDGVLESPIFDGMSVIVEDMAVGAPDLEKTGWAVGDTDLSISVSGGSVLIAVLRVELLETETDYELIVSDAVADTSVSGYGLPTAPLYFHVVGRDDRIKRKLLFRDRARDGRLGDGDVLHILEPDRDGELAPAWEFRFSADAETVLPEAGDTFVFVPLRKLSSDDVFEFVARLGVSVDEPAVAPDGLVLSAFPNPFADSITIGFRLEVPSHVRIDAFDLLGRRVAVLEDAARSPGGHEFVWDGRWRNGPPAASGMYLILLTATPEGGQPSLTARRAVTLVR